MVKSANSDSVVVGDSRASDDAPPHLVIRRGVICAGSHVLLDLYEAHHLDDADHVSNALVSGAEAAGATVLETSLHGFEPSGGITGVVLLSESHMSIHSWPEYGFAALDIFMCGSAALEKTIATLVQAFTPSRYDVQEFERGVLLSAYSGSLRGKPAIAG